MAKIMKTGTAPAKLPAADAVLLGDPAIKPRLFYRDASDPAGSVWYAADDPAAKGELVILQE